MPFLNKKVSVVHLIWLPFGIDLFKEFIQSYQTHPSGHKHELVLLFNGVKNNYDLVPYNEFADQQEIRYKSFQLQYGSDLEAYRWIASQLDTNYILFLNSYSKFLNDNWLQHFMTAAALPNVGIVGATGTYHSIFSMIQYETRIEWEKDRNFKENFRNLKLLVKNSFLYRAWFPPFPNPHVRTNSFLIKRNLFLSLSFITIKKKYDAYRLESGRNSFTRQIMKKGFQPLIVDKFGNSYEIKDWEQSHTFWIGDQSNLLISDNQTEKYIKATEEEKKFFTLMAWGHE